jgi:hypothetical protein
MHALLQSTASYTPAAYQPFEWFDSSSCFTPPRPTPRRLVRITDRTDSAGHTSLADAADEQAAKAAERAIQHTRAMIEVTQRFYALREEAAVEDEPISIPSANALYRFLLSLCIKKRPSLFLLENGNFQAVWRNDDKEQISLQFIGRDTVQFAMFAKRDGYPMARIAGQDTAAEVRAKIIEHGCGHLIV